MNATDYICNNARYHKDGTYSVILPNGRTIKAADTMKLVTMAVSRGLLSHNTPAKLISSADSWSHVA